MTRTHTHIQPFNGPLCRPAWVRRYQKKHSPTHTHPVHQTSFICFLHLLRSIAPRSVYVLDSPFPQPLSRFSLVFLLVCALYFMLHAFPYPIHQHHQNKFLIMRQAYRINKDICAHIVIKPSLHFAFSALMLLVGRQEGHPACKN